MTKARDFKAMEKRRFRAVTLLEKGLSQAEDFKKKARAEGRTIVFIDDSGLTQKPHRVRTWSPKGQTPLLLHHFNWKNLGAIAGLTWVNFYFRLFSRPGPALPSADCLLITLQGATDRFLATPAQALSQNAQ